MTAHEALWLIKAQLQKNDQNLEAVQVIEELVKEYYYEPLTLEDIRDSMFKTYTLDEAIEELGLGTEAEHMRNHMAKVAKQDIHELHEREKYHANWVDENGYIHYKEVLDADE